MVNNSEPSSDSCFLQQSTNLHLNKSSPEVYTKVASELLHACMFHYVGHFPCNNASTINLQPIKRAH
jgi:hypothetical protein